MRKRVRVTHVHIYMWRGESFEERGSMGKEDYMCTRKLVRRRNVCVRRRVERLLCVRGIWRKRRAIKSQAGIYSIRVWCMCCWVALAARKVAFFL